MVQEVTAELYLTPYSFIGGAVFGVIGTIICATAKSINVLIGANVIMGVANATQLSFHVVMGELVPMKYRYVINAIIYSKWSETQPTCEMRANISSVFCIPGSGLGSIIAYSFVVHYPSLSWRGPYWLLVAINAIALVLWVL